MNLFRTRMFLGIDQLARIHPPLCCSGNHDTSGLILPPLDTLSGNHPEPVVHPQMNFRSEQRVLHRVRIPITFHLSCHASVCICLLCIYCFFPPYSPIDPAAVVDYTAAEYDYVIDDPTTTVELAGKQSHSLPQISPIFPYISCTRHCYCCCYVYNPIQLHSLFLSPLAVPPLSYAAYYYYALFSSEPCALLARIR